MAVPLVEENTSQVFACLLESYRAGGRIGNLTGRTLRVSLAIPECAKLAEQHLEWRTGVLRVVLKDGTLEILHGIWLTIQV